MSKSTVSDLAELLAASEALERDFEKDTPWWRGHADVAWQLKAQVHRLDYEPYREPSLLTHFIARAPSRSNRPCPANDDHFGWLFMAQHYGLPTRLLDWSESPLVAAYFAVEDPDKDGCIWALSPSNLNHRLNGVRHLVTIRNPALAKFAAEAFRTDGEPLRTVSGSVEAIFAIDGQDIDPRMLAQMSRFTLHAHNAALESLTNSEKWLRKYVIPKKAKAKIRKQLNAVGVRPWNLFPDLENLAKEVKKLSFLK